MLIPPSYFYEKKWLRTAFDTDAILKHIDISRSTYERIWREDGVCSPKTLQKINRHLVEQKRALGLADRPPDWNFDPERPWRTIFLDLIPSAVNSRHHKLSHAVEVMLRIEDVFLAFKRQVEQQGGSSTRSLTEAGLPDDVLPQEFEFYFTKIISAQAQGLPRPDCPDWFGKAMLRTNLFVLAAWEVAILKAKTYIRNKAPFIHKCLPKMINGKYAAPIKMLLESLQQHFDLPMNKAFAAKVEVSTTKNGNSEPEESAIRRIIEWKSGKTIPSFDTIRGIALKLAPEDEAQQAAIAFSYTIRRFIQELYDRIKEPIKSASQQLEIDAELVSVFQEYPKWYAHHEARYDQWIKQGATQP
jgi:hypothetical protein